MKFFALLLILLASAAMLAQTTNSGPTKVTGKSKSTPSGVEYWDIKVGDGAVATPGRTVRVHYSGWLPNSKKPFDSSVNRGEPLEFSLGAGRVIKGWEEGIA